MIKNKHYILIAELQEKKQDIVRSHFEEGNRKIEKLNNKIYKLNYFIALGIVSLITNIVLLVYWLT